MISLIAAIDDKNGMGKKGFLPWHISEDMKWFRETTRGHPVIMGRKTFDSIEGRVLPNRTNFVITRDISQIEPQENLIVLTSLTEAIEKAQKVEGGEEVFILGGGQVYEQAIHLVDRLYLTRVEGDFDCDVFFPDYSQFSKEVYKRESKDEEHSYTFYILEKTI